MLLSRFLNTADWPLCSHTQQIYLWLATMIIASRSSPSTHTEAHGSIWKQASVSRSSNASRNLKFFNFSTDWYKVGTFDKTTAAPCDDVTMSDWVWPIGLRHLEFHARNLDSFKSHFSTIMLNGFLCITNPWSDPSRLVQLWLRFPLQGW